MEEFEYQTLLDRKGLSDGLDALGERLVKRLNGEEVTVVAILGGAVVFAADLMRRLPAGIILDFLRIQTYGKGTAPSSEPRADWLPHPENVRDRHVLLLDDILDTGRTMKEARRILIEDMGAMKVTVAVLVDKPVRRAVEVVADDRVMILNEDLFLVGYGLDLAGRYRNLPELLALDVPEGASLTGRTLRPRA
jgi:hypoxanthine phosphoribosyltransferase